MLFIYFRKWNHKLDCFWNQYQIYELSLRLGIQLKKIKVANNVFDNIELKLILDKNS